MVRIDFKNVQRVADVNALKSHCADSRFPLTKKEIYHSKMIDLADDIVENAAHLNIVDTVKGIYKAIKTKCAYIKDKKSVA